MSSKREYHGIAEYMKAFDRLFLFLPGKVADEHKREIELHLRQLAQQSLLTGMTEDEAERQAIIAFGAPRKVAWPLVMRWLDAARVKSENRRPRFYFLPLLITFAMPGCVLAFPPDTSPMWLQISIALTCGLACGISSSVINLYEDLDMPLEVREKEYRRYKEYMRQPKHLNENSVSRLFRQIMTWFVRGTVADIIERERPPLAILNRDFFLAYGFAFLLANLFPLPALVSRMSNFILVDLMAMRITSALRQHLEQRPRV